MLLISRLGQILLENGSIADEDLQYALACQQKVGNNQKLLGEILVDTGRINSVQLFKALTRQATSTIITREFLISRPQMFQEEVKILSLSFHNLSQSELLSQFKKGVCFTPNVDHLMRLERDQEFFEVYKHADYRVCDSQILFHASRFLGTPIKEKISGSDFFPAFYKFHRYNPDIKIYLLGGAEGSAPQAHQNINQKMGRNIIIGSHTPSFGFDQKEDECLAIVEEINRVKPTVLAVGVGAPKQEKWIVKYKDMMPSVKIFLAIGATIDFEGGITSRAPQWISQAGLEWLYRVSCEPRRLWRRYFIEDLPILWLILKQKLGHYNPPFS